MAGFFTRIRSSIYFDRYSLVQFFRQLATLSAAGFGALRGVQTCLKQTSEPRLKAALENIGARIERGLSYSEAIAKSGDVFTPFHVSMMQAAEASGNLPQVLDSLAEYEENEMNLRYRLKSATIYPIFVLVFSLVCIILLMKFLSPLLDVITRVLKGDIPWPTMILMRISTAVSHPLFWIGLLLGIISLNYLYRYYMGTRTGRMIMDSIRFKVPMFGELYQKVIMIRVCRVLKTLLESGVPATEAMELVGDVADNFYFKDRIMGEIAYRIKEGADISASFKGTGFFPPMMISMISIGEQSGTLPQIMGHLSRIYNFDVEIAVANFYATLEPVLIVVMGMVTFLIMAAAFLPIYQIIGTMTR